MDIKDTIQHFEECDQKGCVYFIKHNYTDYVKIGMTNSDTPEDRFKSFLTYAPLGGVLIGYIKTNNAKKLEAKIHYKYKKQRKEGEWFKMSIEEVRQEMCFHKNYVDCIKDITIESIISSQKIIDYIKSNKLKTNELIDMLEACVNHLDILPVSEMARAENKSRNGILISSNYRKVQIGKSKLAVKGVKDVSFPF